MSTNNYSLQKPGSFIDRLASKKRQIMYNLFIKNFSPHTDDKILDVGVTADRTALSSNFFEKYYPYKQNIIALSNQEAYFLETKYPGLTYKQGDARSLPFSDECIDYVFSSAVMEHVGSQDQQLKMLSECYRVARKGVFITTPNRWHPIEAHTFLPLIHWLPKPLHRKILKWLGLDFYAQVDNLNLLDRATLIHFCKILNADDYSIMRIRTLGWTSNLILLIRKNIQSSMAQSHEE